ncbi:polyubiquitin 11-like isoform X1 [Clupea harengus]|uniref:Polyubiquitin 11-like isoform X1 n=1 Tax=Clupea harengus TaxID=7950 RepID=A0A6P3VSY0_CLUHA|nr:polyubiquitin 11-like isoform X1 [Clupea harengus]
MDIIIKFLSGPTYPLAVNSSITVGDLKKRIQQLSGDVPACQKLSNENGINFSNDSSTLSALGLKSGSFVVVLVTNPPPIPPIQVFLKNEKGQTSTYDVTPGETVTAFKSKVHIRERVPVDQQRLIFEGKQLDDGRTLEDYNIRSESTIYLTLRLRGG